MKHKPLVGPWVIDEGLHIFLLVTGATLPMKILFFHVNSCDLNVAAGIFVLRQEL